MKFEHLKLSDVNPALEETRLRDLGRINVVCGKNSSGKSTVLQGILSHRTIGRRLDPSEIEELTWFPTVWYPAGASNQTAANDDEIDPASGVKDFWTKYFRAQEALLAQHPVWFSDEANHFALEFLRIGKSINRQDIFGKVSVDIRRVFDHVMQDPSVPILLPTKRNLQLTGQQSPRKSTSVSPDGKGILSDLFFLKNQPNKSDEFKFYHKIRGAFERVSSGHTFNITQEKKDDLLLRFAFEDHDEVEAENCGLGLQDLLIILYFALSSEHEILLIEEPENHMHPEMQRKLLRFLSEETDKQYFLTTHSTVYLNSTYVNRVFFTQSVAGKIEVSDATSRARILHSLGFSVTDNLASDLIILVEGSGDREFIEEMLSKSGLDARFNIKIWILGGDEMVHQDLSAFREDYQVVALVDRDPESEKARKAFADSCRKHEIGITRLSRYSIESYFPITALNAVFNRFNKNLPEIGGHTDKSLQRLIGSKPVWDKLGASPQRQKRIKTMLKRNIRDIAKETSLSELEGTDLMGFLDNVKKVLQDNAISAE